MCKVIGFTNFNKVRKKLDTVEYLSRLLLGTEKDGFGYAIWNKNTQSSFGERTDARNFSSLARTSSVPFSFCEAAQASQNSFGQFDMSNVGAAIFHGRISTNNKSLLNTHPMVRNGWSLIHNGVVTDHGEKYEKITTNDSEDVLHRYVEGTFEQALTGYYAFLTIDPTGKLHVARDKIANLHSSWIDSLETYIFSTTAENIVNVCNVLGVDYSTILKVKEDQLVVFEGNEIKESRSISSRGYGYRESRYSQQSLGYNLGGGKEDPKTCGLTTGTGSTTTATGNVVTLSKAEKKRQKRAQQSVLPTSLTKDEIAFIQEVELMDASYTVINPKGRMVKLETFKQLAFAQQKHFDVIRGDGTVVDWRNYSEDRLYNFNW